MKFLKTSEYSGTRTIQHLELLGFASIWNSINYTPRDSDLALQYVSNFSKTQIKFSIP